MHQHDVLTNVSRQRHGLRVARAIGAAIGGFTVGYFATMSRSRAVGTIVKVEDVSGLIMVTLNFDDPQPVDVPVGATCTVFKLNWRCITSTWAPAQKSATQVQMQCADENFALRDFFLDESDGADGKDYVCEYCGWRQVSTAGGAAELCRLSTWHDLGQYKRYALVARAGGFDLPEKPIHTTVQ